MPTRWQRGAPPTKREDAGEDEDAERPRLVETTYTPPFLPAADAPAHPALPSQRRQSIRLPVARSQPLREIFAGCTHSRLVIGRRQARRGKKRDWWRSR